MVKTKTKDLSQVQQNPTIIELLPFDYPKLSRCAIMDHTVFLVSQIYFIVIRRFIFVFLFFIVQMTGMVS